MSDSSAPNDSRSGQPGELPTDHGLGPPFEVTDLPAPLPFSARNLFKVIGPGAILLATSIGGGEWLVGPVQGVKHGVSLFWVATVAIILQLVFNLEAIRYTLYTGEPIYGGLLRLWPGRRFWGTYYCIVAFLQLCWPALALLCANTLVSAFMGQLPVEGDEWKSQVVAGGLILFVLGLLQFGGTIERMLEWASWFMLAFIFTFLIFVNVWFIPLETWITTLKGFLGLSANREAVIDWGLLGALAATAGTGGIGNLTITNWMRDKGFGMGSLVGAIPSAVGARHIKLSASGKIFPVTPENLSRWKTWMRYVSADQVWVWAVFCFLGMYLNVNFATGVIPAGTKIDGLAAGAYQAEYIAKAVWSGFWFLTLLNGFWILFSTQLGNTDILARTVTDVLWLSSSRVRRWRGGDVKAVYYLALVVFSGWGLLTLRSASAAELFKMLGNMAGLILGVASFQIVIVNRRFLPRSLRPPLRNEIILVGTGLFYSYFTALWFYSLWANSVGPWIRGLLGG